MNVISFPGLGFVFNINHIALNVLGKDIYWYGIIISFGFVLAWLFTVNEAKKQRLNSDTMFDVGMYGLVFGIICARIYYVIFDPSSYEGNFLRIFAIWEGGIAIYGGIIGGILSTYIYCRIKKLDTMQIFDIGAMGLMIGQMIGRFGNFTNVEVYGVATDLPWRMSINGAKGVHPLFFYEALWMLIGFVALLLYKEHKKANGEIFWLYIMWYGMGRIWLEGLRQSEYILYLIPQKVGISQVVSFVAIVVAIFMLIRIYKQKPLIKAEITNAENITNDIEVDSDNNKNSSEK